MTPEVRTILQHPAHLTSHTGRLILLTVELTQDPDTEWAELSHWDLCNYVGRPLEAHQVGIEVDNLIHAGYLRRRPPRRGKTAPRYLVNLARIKNETPTMATIETLLALAQADENSGTPTAPEDAA